MQSTCGLHNQHLDGRYISRDQRTSMLNVDIESAECVIYYRHINIFVCEPSSLDVDCGWFIIFLFHSDDGYITVICIEKSDILYLPEQLIRLIHPLKTNNILIHYKYRQPRH